MNEQIRSFLLAEPFRPFKLYLGDGRSVCVTRPGQIAYGGAGTAVVVRPDDSFVVFDLPMVAAAEAMPPAAPEAAEASEVKVTTRDEPAAESRAADMPTTAPPPGSAYAASMSTKGKTTFYVRNSPGLESWPAP